MRDDIVKLGRKVATLAGSMPAVHQLVVMSLWYQIEAVLRSMADRIEQLERRNDG